MKIKTCLLVAMLVGGVRLGLAHPGHEEAAPPLYAALNENITQPPAPLKPTSAVKVTIEGDARIFRANGLPDHTPGTFPNRGNPNSIAAQNYTFRVPLMPKTNATLRPGQGAWFGIALNGVPFEPGTGEFWNGQREWNYEARSGFINLGLDQHNAHVQPNGAYHYHGLPVGLMENLGSDGTKILLVGYAADGFPIYTSYGHGVATNVASELQKVRSSWQLKKGDRAGGPGGKHDGRFTADYEYVAGSGDLDECNGRFGVTPEFPQGIYCYHITDEFPQVGRFWRGTPNPSFFKRGPRPAGPGGRGGPPPAQRVPGAPPPSPRL